MNESMIFEAASQKPQGPKRDAFLQETCGDDAELRQRVEALLRAHDNPESFLERPAEKLIESGPDETVLHELERHGKQIGPYKLLQQIGEGGMGIVFVAEQTEPVRRRVALKIIKPGMDSRQVIARFEAERQALAMMDHPNIAKVLDAGTTSQGRPYFVMEFVNGLPITEYCDEHNLTPNHRLKLFAAVCRGIQHAHQKGVIHRDLKPSNILVAEYDHDAVPKVIDFGIAKATNQSLTEKTVFTEVGQIVGTLEYMSPEQAKRNQLDVDTRSDIYSLGIVLYELLTGDTPFDKQRLRSAAFDEMLRIIREEEPQLPSSKLSASKEIAKLASRRGVDPHRLNTLVRGDLDWIVLKTLAKDRSQRYATALELAEDVGRHLADHPILAGPPRIVARVKKFAKRNAWPLLLSATALVVILSVTLWFVQSSKDAARQIAERSNRTSEAIDEGSLALGRAINSPVHSDAQWTAAQTSLRRVEDLLAEGEVSAEVTRRANLLLARGRNGRTERDIAVRLEDLLIRRASHPELASWQQMAEDLEQLFTDHGFDLQDPETLGKKIHDHRFAVRFADILELWIGTVAITRPGPETLQPWADAIYVADKDPLRTGIRRLFYSGKPPTEEQVRTLTDGVDLATIDTRTVGWLSAVYAYAGLPEEGEQIHLDALRRNPRDVMLNFDRGLSLAHQGRYQEATRWYSRAIALRPDSAGAWQMLGMALEELDELDNAREAYERSCELEDDYGPTWANLGNVLLKLNKHDEALKAGRRAMQLQPDDAAAHGVTGRALMQQENFAEALPILEKCVMLAEQDPDWDQPSQEWLAECKKRIDEK